MSYPAAYSERRLSHGGSISSASFSRIEYAYYLVIAYSVLSEYLEIEVPLLAAAMILALAVRCYMRLRPYAASVFRPIRLLLGCTSIFILIQFAFHDGTSSDTLLRTIFLWSCALVIGQTLSLRPGFLLRSTLVLIAIALVAVPNLATITSGSVERAAAGVELGGNLRNANGLGAWFGFCFVALTLFGLEAKAVTSRTLYWVAAIGCLFVALLSVSRGALIASAIAVTVGLRDVLKRGFVPVLLLVVLSGIAVESGIFGRAITLYSERGLEETGRIALWPFVVERIVASPLVGVGINNMGTYVPEENRYIVTPHNTFLFFALSSGVIPFLLWTLFWFRSAKRALARHHHPSPYDRFRLPFLLYLLVTFTLGDINGDPWVALAIAVVASPVIVRTAFRREARSTQAWANESASPALTVAP
jgi:O-antigen ligase